MSLLSKMRNAGTIKNVDVISDSIYINKRDMIRTPIPALNVAFSGSLDGGLTPGFTVFAGPSRHFKTSMSLVCVASYLKKYEEAVCLFYDSEFGTTEEYLEGCGVDSTRVLHIPVTDLGQMKNDMMQRLDQVERGDKVIIFIDSLGNISSKKELEDALGGKDTQDMTRAKVMKGFFRMLTPHLTIKDIPAIGVAHVYDEIGPMYPKTIISGGTAIILASNQAFIITRSQEKDPDTKQVIANKFTLVCEKSRFIKEKSKIPIEVSYDGGISPFSGLLDWGVDLGVVEKPKKGWYTRPCVEDDKNWRAKETECSEFWEPVFKNSDFKKQIENRFRIGGEIEEEEGEDDDTEE